MKLSRSKKRKRNYSDVDDENSNDERCSSNDSSLGSGGHEQECAEDQNELVLDIKPLTEYIDDRKKLNDELFKIMGRKEMKKLMPKSIKVCICSVTSGLIFFKDFSC